MQILVNGSPLDFSLEENTSLEDIIGKIQQWASEKKLYILDYTVSPSNQSQPVFSADIDTLDIVLGSQEELLVENLSELDSYLDRIGMFLARHINQGSRPSDSELADIAGGLQWIGEVLSGVFAAGQLPAALEKPLQAIAAANAMSDLSALLAALAEIKKQSSAILRNYRFKQLTDEQISAFSREFIAAVPELLAMLEKIASGLTVGRDSEALFSLQNLIEYLYDGLTVLARSGKARAESENLVKALTDLVAALDQADTVMAADIVDYDLAEALNKLSEAV